MKFVAITARGTEPVLAGELDTLGVGAVVAGRGSVTFEGPLELGYRACLWLRTASRVLLPLAQFPPLAGNAAEALYEAAASIDWREHLRADGTLAIDCALASGVAGHSRFYAQRTKDAICDQFRERTGIRPSVDRDRPELRIHLHCGADATRISIDLAGESLHRRGYRSGADGEVPAAPLKENLAAALLLMAGWPERAAAGAPLVDPLCGSGTFLIEAAWIAGDIAPGLLRAGEAPPGRWRGHDPAAWRRVIEEARERARSGAGAVPSLYGFDASATAVRIARAAARRAGVGEAMRFERCDLTDLAAPAGPPGLVIANPPYGERLGDESELGPLYEQLGDMLRRRFIGWQAFVLTGSTVLAKQIGLKPARRHPIWNGPIECRLLDFPIASTEVQGDAVPHWRKPGPGAEAFVNRLRKAQERMRRWAASEGIECYRLYDADLPEYNVAIDIYGSHAVVQEYAPPRSVDPAVAASRLRDVRLVVPEVLGIAPDAVTLKVRRRQVQGRQYQRRGESVRVPVREGDTVFLVSFDDHLDTGLFLDHRILRRIVARAAAGRSLLNLFAYTCTMSVAAARAGATRTVNVDLSATYLDWGFANFVANDIAPGSAHRFVRNDCLDFLDRERGSHGVIFLNPPSYSRSHRMQGDFEIRRDHPTLLRRAMRRLTLDGELYFSTHARGFTLDPELAEEFEVQDLTARAVPKDFIRSPFAAFRIAHRDADADNP